MINDCVGGNPASCVDCGNELNKLRSGLFEPEFAGRKGSWTYVGQGRGTYEGAQSYNYVGLGAGSFEKDEVVTYEGWRPRRCCVGWLLCSVSVFLVVVALFALRALNSLDGFGGVALGAGAVAAAVAGGLPPPGNGSNTTAPAPPSLNSSSDAAATYTAARPRDQAHTTTTQPYNCSVGRLEGLDAWSPAMRAWCCRTYGPRCVKPRTTTTAAPASMLVADYNCTDGEPWTSDWSADKQTWCCLSTGRGCPTVAPATTAAPATTSRQAPAKPAAAPPRADGCSATCEYLGKSASCDRRVRYAVEHRYADHTESCRLGHHWVKKYCPVCSACALVDTYCAPAPRPTPPAPQAGGAAPAGQASPAPPATPAPSTTPAPRTRETAPADSASSALPAMPEPVSQALVSEECEASCALQGHVSTCREEIQRSADLWFDQPKPCELAHNVVVSACAGCSKCSVKGSGCTAQTQPTLVAL